MQLGTLDAAAITDMQGSLSGNGGELSQSLLYPRLAECMHVQPSVVQQTVLSSLGKRHLEVKHPALPLGLLRVKFPSRSLFTVC